MPSQPARRQRSTVWCTTPSFSSSTERASAPGRLPGKRPNPPTDMTDSPPARSAPARVLVSVGFVFRPKPTNGPSLHQYGKHRLVWWKSCCSCGWTCSFGVWCPRPPVRLRAAGSIKFLSVCHKWRGSAVQRVSGCYWPDPNAPPTIAMNLPNPLQIPASPIPATAASPDGPVEHFEVLLDSFITFQLHLK